MTVLLINRLGGGWIVLPGHGLGLVLGFAAYAVFQDLGEYLFHRAEHAVPGLWAMHSLHHSDRHFDASTGIPHHWGVPLVQSITTTVPLWDVLFGTVRRVDPSSSAAGWSGRGQRSARLGRPDVLDAAGWLMPVHGYLFARAMGMPEVSVLRAQPDTVRSLALSNWACRASIAEPVHAAKPGIIPG